MNVVEWLVEKEDNMFQTSHSKTKLARRCLKAYEYRYLMKLQRRVKSRALIVGSLVHNCLEMYFREGYYLPAIREWKEGEFTKMFAEEQALHKDVIPLARQLIKGYISNWKSLDLEMLWVEKEFSIEISPGITLIGKIDGLARDSRKMRWLVEHKTCKKMPGEEVRIYDTQVLLYAGALPFMDEEPVNGVIWDYLRTKLPTKPHLLKSGGLSVAQSIDTTKEVYLQAIRKHGLDPRGYVDILEHLETKRDQFYRQVKLPMNDIMGQNILHELITTSEMLIGLEHEYKEGGINHCTRNLTRDCSWCDYNTLCHAELRGEDTEYLLKHDYIVRVKHGNKEEKTDLDIEQG